MVAQCAGCNTYEPWAALLIGLMAGGVFQAVHLLMLKVKLDDPLDAVAVHAGGGILGVICAPLFKSQTGIFWIGSYTEDDIKEFIGEDVVSPWVILGSNLLGLVAIIAWSVFWSGLIFGSLYAFNWLRIDRETEFKGNDMVKHGESAYPASSWTEVQYYNNNRKQSADQVVTDPAPLTDNWRPPQYHQSAQSVNTMEFELR